MKNILGLLFFSLFVNSAGFGCVYSSFNDVEIQRAKDDAESSKVVTISDSETFKLGTYPQDICLAYNSVEVKQGTKKVTSGGKEYYEYHDKKYFVIDTCEVDLEEAGSRKLSDGEAVDTYSGTKNVVIEFQDIEWELLKKNDDGTAYLISTRVLEREQYNFRLDNAVAFKDSNLKEYLEKNFREMAFSSDDMKYLASQEITIPTKSDVDLDKFKDSNLKQASDYAILDNLSSHSAYNHGSGVPYVNAPYWLDTISSSEPDKIEVCWAKVAYSSYLMDENKIGVRPVIKVNYNASGGGSGGGEITPAKRSSGGGGNATLVVGIVFMVVGAGGLVAFFVYWSKKHKDGKPPIWLIASIGCCLIISVVGIGCFSGGVSGGNTVVGWYQGNNYDCVGFGERLAINLTADGKVYRYVGDAWVDSATNYLLVLQPGVGEWEYSNGKLTIYASAEWNLSSWEGLEVTYNDCNGLGSFLHYEGYVGSAYQWYHYSRVDSAGVASIRVADTHESGNINFGLRGF